MTKKYIVRLTDQERDELAAVIKKFKGTSQKVRRAQILSKGVDAAVDGSELDRPPDRRGIWMPKADRREYPTAPRGAWLSRDPGRR